DPDRAAPAHSYPLAFHRFQPARRQRPQLLQFHSQLFPPAAVAAALHVAQELPIGHPAGEFAMSPAAPIVGNGQVTDPYQSLPAMAKPLQKALLDEVTGSGQNKRHGNSSWGLVGPGSCSGFPFFILSSSNDRYPNVQLNCARLFSPHFSPALYSQ